MEIYFVRHGETEVNVSGSMHQIEDQTGLTPLGRKQIEKVGLLFVDREIDIIYHSPEARTHETAEILASYTRAPLVVMGEFRERDWGDWSQRKWEDIKAVLDKMEFSERYSFRPPGGESALDVKERVRRGIKTLVSGSYKSLIVVTHGGTLKYVVPIMKKEPMRTGLTYDFENASVSLFVINNGNTETISINDVSHLAG